MTPDELARAEAKLLAAQRRGTMTDAERELLAEIQTRLYGKSRKPPARKGWKTRGRGGGKASTTPVEKHDTPPAKIVRGGLPGLGKRR
ncbi:hypothetical protein JN535_08540 [Cellulosimicrobium cellulans]|uniref:hypothetical protein n=1 Tax=Cellulosimicrobium cellulans TaxID=1710 RepID=UPI001963A7B9|nr:hypothetical protein [Cellulosimicrobium cellulans]MBN0040213.1 hypothetical protein [Cellulosimicrobium cellulans]